MRPLRIAFPQMSDARGSPAPNPNDPGLLGPAEVSLLIDLYELTMSASYLERGMNDPAVFELFARRLPHNRDWLLAAGVDPTLQLVQALRFGQAELDTCGLSACSPRASSTTSASSVSRGTWMPSRRGPHASRTSRGSG